MQKERRLREHLHAVRLEQFDDDTGQLGVELVVLRASVEIVARLILRNGLADGVALQQSQSKDLSAVGRNHVGKLVLDNLFWACNTAKNAVLRRGLP